MKHALFAASLALVAGAALGCGGSSDGSAAPANASTKDFCAGFTSLSADMGDVNDDSDPSALIKKVKEAAATMKDNGTPKDIPADARDGFEIFVDTIAGVDEDASLEELQKVGDDLSDAEEKKFDAFDTYLTDTCAPS